jgi:hypothetical protein
MTDPNLPVQWAEKLAESAKEIAALERPSLSNISLRGGVMMYQNQKVPGNKLTCIIISSVVQHRYYSKPFDVNNPANPDCFALSLTGDEMVPHEDSKEKQSVTCESCDKFKWGSAGEGKRGKACRASRRLGLVPEIPRDGDPVEFIKKAEVAVLTVPVTSIRNWGSYVNGIAVEYRRPPWSVFTEITIEPDPNKQFLVRFACKGIVADESVLGALHMRREPIDQILLTPYDASGDGEGEEKKEDDGKTKKY